MRRFKKLFLIGTSLILLIIISLSFSGVAFLKGLSLKPAKVNAAEIIKKSLGKILAKGTIYHHKALYYRYSQKPNQSESMPIIYEIWEDQDSDRFKQVVTYADGKKTIQAFDGDIRWDYNEEEDTLRKDIYVYSDPKEREIKHGKRLDLAEKYRRLLNKGDLIAYEDKLENRPVWRVIDKRQQKTSYWNTFYFDKETFLLIQEEKWVKKNGKETKTEKISYPIMESIPRQNLNIAKFFSFNLPLSKTTKILERHFNTATGYIEDSYYSASTQNWKIYQNSNREYSSYTIKFPENWSFEERFAHGTADLVVVFNNSSGKPFLTFTVSSLDFKKNFYASQKEYLGGLKEINIGGRKGYVFNKK